MDLDIGGRKWKASFDDWLYLQDDGVLINVATLSKWGVKLGTLTFTFAKEGLIDPVFRNQLSLQ